ncbi:hypothetical protein DY000_02014963 [Brassica cretica]|uniref:Uncharacterized protein n=1 Tax=Brassica cretica TaxID=69181 RepID=A0ABQ7CW08_BRACR|nr:hypothetical protein DY000_02014963 [Brassica cretica]
MDDQQEVSSTDDQQEVSYVTGQGWLYKNYHPNPNVRNNPHLFAYPKLDKLVDNAQNSQGQNIGYQNQKQQTAQQAAPSPTTAPQEEMKGLATMMHKLL